MVFCFFLGRYKIETLVRNGFKTIYALTLDLVCTTKKSLREKVKDVSKKVTHHDLLRFFLRYLDLFFSNFRAVASQCGLP